MKYALITPARNEARFVQKTLDSMVAQTLRPERWVIVDDGSTDRTSEMIGPYAKRHPWIELIRRPKRESHSFAGKVQAFNEGFDRIRGLQFDVIGNLDADLSFEPDYLEFLTQKFAQDPKLGVAGTPFIEDGYDSGRDSFEGQSHVAGGCQLFRRTCFEEIGGYIANRSGGIDWMAVTTARMKGWKTRSFPEKRFHHHRPLGTAQRNKIKATFSYGEKDYYLGNSPLWQLFRVGYRMAKPPYVVEGMALMSGFCWAALRRTERPVSPELMRFHRDEQMQKLKAIFGSLLQFKSPDNFNLSTKTQPISQHGVNASPARSGQRP